MVKMSEKEMPSKDIPKTAEKPKKKKIEEVTPKVEEAPAENEEEAKPAEEEEKPAEEEAA